jgi:hypothetical protein
MEQPDSRLPAEPQFYCLHHVLEIARELLVVMMRRESRYILSVIAKIENYQVKVSEQVLPVGKVGVSGEAVAMGKQQTHAIGATVAPHKNRCAIVEHNVKDHAGYGKLEMHQILAAVWVRRTRIDPLVLHPHAQGCGSDT